MDQGNVLQALQDLCFGPKEPLTGLGPESLSRRNALLRPLLIQGAKVMVYAGSPPSYWRAGINFPRTGRRIEVAAADAPGDPVRVGPGALEEVLADTNLLLMPMPKES